MWYVILQLCVRCVLVLLMHENVILPPPVYLLFTSHAAAHEHTHAQEDIRVLADHFLLDWNWHCLLWKSSQDCVRRDTELDKKKKGGGEKRRKVGEGQQGRGGVRGVMDGRINSGEGMRKERTRRCDMMGEGETWGERRCSDSVSTGVWNRPDIWSVCLCVCKRDYKSWRPAPFLLHTQEKTKTLLVGPRWFFQGQKVTHPTSTVQPIQTYTSTQTT